VAELAYAAASRAALLWVQLPPGLPEFCRSLTIQRRVGRTVRHLSAKQGLSQEANGFNSRTLRHAEGTAEWPATGPENRGIVMSDGRSIRLGAPGLSERHYVRETFPLRVRRCQRHELLNYMVAGGSELLLGLVLRSHEIVRPRSKIFSIPFPC
jgi:hypothetical protein